MLVVVAGRPVVVDMELKVRFPSSTLVVETGSEAWNDTEYEVSETVVDVVKSTAREVEASTNSDGPTVDDVICRSCCDRYDEGNEEVGIASVEARISACSNDVLVIDVNCECIADETNELGSVSLDVASASSVVVMVDIDASCGETVDGDIIELST